MVALVNKHAPSNPHLGITSFKAKINNVISYLRSFVSSGKSITADDLIVHNLLTDAGSTGKMQEWTNMNNSNDANETTANIVGNRQNLWSGSIAKTMQAFKRADGPIERAEIESEIPVMQAILLALALTLGPMVILLGMVMSGGACIGTIFTYYFFIGSLFFMAFIERFLRYLESSIHASQSYGMYALGNSYMTYNVFTKAYLYAPLVYLLLMGMAGLKLGQMVNEAMSNKVSGGGGGTAGKALGVAGTAAKTVIEL